MKSERWRFCLDGLVKMEKSLVVYVQCMYKYICMFLKPLVRIPLFYI